MATPYCDLFPSNRTDDSETIILGFIVKTTKLPRQRRQMLNVNGSIHEAYIAEQWAIFPTRECLTRYIIALEGLHIELDGKKEITKEDVKQTIRRIEGSGEADEEFIVLTRKGYKLPGISELSIHLPLPVDPEIVWDFETDRFRRVVESWVENSDPVIKEARDQLEAAAWLDILTNVDEHKDWGSKASLCPQRFRVERHNQ